VGAPGIEKRTRTEKSKKQERREHMQRTRREKEERGKSKDKSNPFITINLSMPVSTPTVKPPTRSATGKMDDNMKSK
jgi:hypothetical protein